MDSQTTFQGRRLVRKLILLAAVISSFALIAVTAQGQTQNPNCPAGTSNPAYCGPPPTAKAPGYWCNKAGESKKHVKGQKGTPFSQCVKALAQIKKNPDTASKKACKNLSKKHVKVQKKTPFAACVKAGNNYRADLKS